MAQRVVLHVGTMKSGTSFIQNVLGENKAALAERGRECAAAFDWSNVAPRVEETYRDAIRMDAEFHPHPTKDVTSP